MRLIWLTVTALGALLVLAIASPLLFWLGRSQEPAEVVFVGPEDDEEDDEDDEEDEDDDED